MTTKQRIIDTKLIAIFRKVPDDKLVATAEALVRGGVQAMEVTFDHGRADCFGALVKQVRMLKDALGDGVSVGAGTVLTPEEVEIAAGAGAELIVSPNMDETVIRRTKELGLVSCPGAMTPTEIVTAYQAGADFVKLFPAEQLGVAFIKAMQGPLGHIPLLAVGGADVNNAGEFIKAGACGIGVSSKLVDHKLISACDWAALEERAAQFINALK